MGAAYASVRNTRRHENKSSRAALGHVIGLNQMQMNPYQMPYLLTEMSLFINSF